MTWFTRKRPSRPAPSLRCRLRLESLTLRAAPSSLDNPTDPTGLNNPAQTMLEDPAGLGAPPPPQGESVPLPPSPSGPTVAIVAKEVGLGVWEIDGTATGNQVAGITVNFGGIPALEGKTATTDANGNFTLVFTVSTNGSDQGTGWAQAVDANGNASNVATADINPTE